MAPKIGSTIYISTSMSIDHGQDDIMGGRATVKSVSTMRSGGADTSFVEVEEIPGRRFNWDQFLFKNQGRLKYEYGDRVAGPDPDFPDAWSDSYRLDWLNGAYGPDIAIKLFVPREKRK